MKHKIITSLLLAFALCTTSLVFGQNKQTFNYNGDFNYDLEWSNNNDQYTIVLTRDNLSDTFSIQPLRPATFTTGFISAFRTILDTDSTLELDTNATSEASFIRRISHQANDVLYYIQAQSIADLDYRPKAGDLKIAEEVTISKFTEDWQLTCNEIKTSGSLGSSQLTPVFKAIYSVISDLNASLDTIKNLDYSLDTIKALLKLDKSDNLALGSSLISKKIEGIQNQLEDIHEPKDHLSDQANNEIFKKIANRTSLELDKIDIKIDSILTELIEKQEEGSLQIAYTAIKKAIKEIKKAIEKAEKDLNSHPFKQKALRAKAKELHYKDNRHSNISAKKQYKTKLLKQARENVIKKPEERIKVLNDSLKVIKFTVSELKKKNDNLQSVKDNLFKNKEKIQKLLHEIEEAKNSLKEKRNHLKNSTNKQNESEQIKLLEKEIKGLDTLLLSYKDSLIQIDSAKTSLLYFVEEKIEVVDFLNEKNKFDIDTINELAKNKGVHIKTHLSNILSLDTIKPDIASLQTQNPKINMIKYFNYFDSLDISLTKKRIDTSAIRKAKKDKLDQLNLNKEKYLRFIGEINAINHSIENKNQSINKIRNCKNKDNDCLSFIDREVKTIDSSLNINNKTIDSLKLKLTALNAKIQFINKNSKYQQTLVIDSVQIEFYEGFIENIWVVGYLKNNPQRSLKFENRAPIRFSSKTAYNKRNNVYLAASEKEDVYWVLYMGDLISYLQNHESGTKDYSPANGSVTWTDLKEVKSLYKKATSKVFEAHVFSDFVGFDEAAPNGLIQMELSKRFNIYTRKFGSFLSKNAVYCKCQGPIYSSNWGFLNFIRPSFIYSKFEEKQRNLQLGVQNKIINGQLQSTKFASTNYILQHEMFNVGATVNAVTLDIPLAKSIAFLNLGFAYGRTELADSIYQYKDKIIRATDVTYYGLNTIRLFAEVVYKIIPEKRYGIETSIRAIWLKGLTDQSSPFFQVNEANQITSSANTNHQWMLRFEISGFFRPSKDSDNKLFLRYRLHGQFENLNYNFHQLQVGYSFYLLRSNIVKTSGPTASK